MTATGGPHAMTTAPADAAPRGELPAHVPIVLLASACWDTPTPTNVHHIARRFADRGHKVLFVEFVGLRRPRAFSTHDRRRVQQRLGRWLRGPVPAEDRDDERLFVLSPVAFPGSVPRSLVSLSMQWLGRSVGRALRTLDMQHPLVWSFLPNWGETADGLHPRLVVYHCVDHYAANPGVHPDKIEDLERRMVARADVVLASSPPLVQRLQRWGGEVLSLPNVADVELFSRAVTDDLPEPRELAGLARPRLVYVGNLAAYRLDFELLHEVARALPDAELVLIGVLGMGDTAPLPAAVRRLQQLPNVTFAGPRPAAELPAWLAHADVALIPFLDNDHTRGSLPLKLWEYLAAGLPVVATDLPNFESLAERGVLRTARDRPGFVAAVRAALDDPPEARADRLAESRGHDWPAQVQRLVRILGDALCRQAEQH